MRQNSKIQGIRPFYCRECTFEEGGFKRHYKVVDFDLDAPFLYNMIAYMVTKSVKEHKKNSFFTSWKTFIACVLLSLNSVDMASL